MIQLTQELCARREDSSSREWLVTNGLGGFACGTVSGINTRRYHGVLVSALHPPRGRHVLIAHLDESLSLDGQRTELGAHAFPGTFSPRGYEHLAGFALSPLPTWRYRVGGALLEKRLFMVHGENTTVLRYTLLESPAALSLILRPFGAFRDFHSHTRENREARVAAEVRPGKIVMHPYDGLPAVSITSPGVFYSSPDWWWNFEHALERERGLDVLEDLFTPGYFTLDLSPGQSVFVTLSSENSAPEDPEDCERRAIARIDSLPPEGESDPSLRALYIAVDAYRAERSDPPALLAGYPWFEDWGRDTLIAFTGAYLISGCYSQGKSVLHAFARYVQQGLVPNRFPDGGGADYNTVDAPLWFFHAARRYVQYTHDRAFGREVLLPALREIEKHFRAGTRYDIHVGDDGLVRAGDPTTQLTWMDAKVGDWVVTPRWGAPVEINALWYAALRTLAAFCQESGALEDSERFTQESLRVRTSFRARFWNASQNYLYDVVREDHQGGSDGAVRPNALYAVALPGELLDAEQRAAVISRARRELLVPLGLRTLSPQDSRYVGRYIGDQRSRDGAYHQGTAWPFLLGAYTTALSSHAKLSGDGALACARREVLGLFETLPDALCAQGLGHLAEILEGDPPHRPVGCFAQAWSDCEALRSMVEDGLGRGPEDTL